MVKSEGLKQAGLAHQHGEEGAEIVARLGRYRAQAKTDPRLLYWLLAERAGEGGAERAAALCRLMELEAKTKEGSIRGAAGPLLQEGALHPLRPVHPLRPRHPLHP